MRVLVCGGRNYRGLEPDQHVGMTLHDLHLQRPIAALIEGGSSGADSTARHWAKSAGVRSVTVPADWHTHGKAAGPIRNQRMIDDFKPDLVLAFPGGRGTADMVRRARAAGVEVREL